jgi:formate dehydrogenase major subunit
MTNSYNDIRHAKMPLVTGGNQAEPPPASLQRILEGKEPNRANMIVVDPAAHATESRSVSVLVLWRNVVKS